MIIDAFLLAFFIIRTLQKRRLKKNEKLPTKVETAVDNKDNNEKKGKQEKPVSQNKKKKKNKKIKNSLLLSLSRKFLIFSDSSK